MSTFEKSEVLKLIDKYKDKYKLLRPKDIRKVSRAIIYIQNNGKVYSCSVANFVDAQEWYDNRANERLFLAQDILNDLNLIK
ncbi:MAG: hypothetical protein KAR20_08665 [Candidatus Heimdallarchaeota archaeon]|nr:hypothetical protein [Candidatus Heimdallarchaeota archaeon]